MKLLYLQRRDAGSINGNRKTHSDAAHSMTGIVVQDKNNFLIFIYKRENCARFPETKFTKLGFLIVNIGLSYFCLSVTKYTFSEVKKNL